MFRDVNGRHRRKSRDTLIAKKRLKLQGNLSRLDDVSLLLGQSGKLWPSSIGKSLAHRFAGMLDRKGQTDLKTMSPSLVLLSRRNLQGADDFLPELVVLN
jgi:hypothetical protein